MDVFFLLENTLLLYNGHFIEVLVSMGQLLEGGVHALVAVVCSGGGFQATAASIAIIQSSSILLQVISNGLSLFIFEAFRGLSHNQVREHWRHLVLPASFAQNSPVHQRHPLAPRNHLVPPLHLCLILKGLVAVEGLIHLDLGVVEVAEEAAVSSLISCVAVAGHHVANVVVRVPSDVGGRLICSLPSLSLKAPRIARPISNTVATNRSSLVPLLLLSPLQSQQIASAVGSAHLLNSGSTPLVILELPRYLS